MMDMKERFKMICAIYLLPIIFMCVAPLLEGVSIDDELLGTRGLMTMGFVFGLMVEGILAMFAATVLVLTGQMKTSRDSDWS